MTRESSLVDEPRRSFSFTFVEIDPASGSSERSPGLAEFRQDSHVSANKMTEGEIRQRRAGRFNERRPNQPYGHRTGRILPDRLHASEPG